VKLYTPPRGSTENRWKCYSTPISIDGANTGEVPYQTEREERRERG